MKQKQLDLLAEELLEAQNELHTVLPLTERYPEISIDDAYYIQNTITQKRVQSGQRIVGRKIGLTSVAMQEMFGVNEPDYGTLYDFYLNQNGGVLDLKRMIQPKIEAEIGFLLKEDIQGENITPFQFLQSCGGVFPCIEIVDSRIVGWKIKIQDTIADNASSGCLFLGPVMYNPLNIDYRVLGLAMYKNDKLQATAAGAAVLGDPVYASAWLANKMLQYGESLKKGDIILSGSLIGAFSAISGDSIVAIFDRIGTVAFSIR